MFITQNEQQVLHTCKHYLDSSIYSLRLDPTLTISISLHKQKRVKWRCVLWKLLSLLQKNRRKYQIFRILCWITFNIITFLKEVAEKSSLTWNFRIKNWLEFVCFDSSVGAASSTEPEKKLFTTNVTKIKSKWTLV